MLIHLKLTVKCIFVHGPHQVLTLRGRLQPGTVPRELLRLCQLKHAAGTQCRALQLLSGIVKLNLVGYEQRALQAAVST